MQFDNQKTRNVADVAARIMAGESVKTQPEMLEEELKGNQHKIDANKNNKVDAHDFKLLRAQKEKEKANSMKYGKDVKEETELEESHFKVGDKVKCKTSGMKGEVVKLDKEDGDEDDKYYTVKREDGKMKKMAPEELTKINEESELDEAMFPGTKEYEKKYGQSPQQKLKKVGDTEKTAQGEMKKTAKGVMHTRRFSEMLESYKETGLKYIAQLGVKEEATQDEYEKEIKKAQNKSEGKEKAEVAKAAVQAVEVQKEQTHTKIEVVDMSDPYNIEKREIDLEEDVEELDEISQKTAVSAYAKRVGREDDDTGNTKSMKTMDRIYKKHGQTGVMRAATAADKEHGIHSSDYTKKDFVGDYLASKGKHKDYSNKVYNKGTKGFAIAEEVEELDEREMTDAEMKERERIVKGMKKGVAGFKQRYGDRAKSVMYATATKTAMKD